MLPLILAGAGLGAAKSIGDKQREKQQDLLAAQTELYSPWTGMHGKIPDKAPSLLEGAAQGGLAGAGAGQSLDKQAMDSKMQDAWLKILQRRSGEPQPAPVDPTAGSYA